MQVWNVLHVLAGNTGCKNVTKKSPSAQHCTICRAESSQLRHVLIIGKKLVKQQYLLQTSLQYAKLRPTNGWYRYGSLGHPGKFQWLSCLGFVTAVISLTGGQPNFARCLAISWAGILVHYIYIFGGSLLLAEFCQVQKLLCIQVLCSFILVVLLQGTPAAGSAKLCGVVQGWN